MKKLIVFVSLLLILGGAFSSVLAGGSLKALPQEDNSFEGIGTYRSQLLQPLDHLVKMEDVVIAVVEPIRRKDAVALSSQDLTAMKRSEEWQLSNKNLGYPFTPVEVEIEESLKGNLKGQLTIWEERGNVGNVRADSDAPYLSVGVRGLLLAGRHENGMLEPLIFAPIDDDGYMEVLDMSLAEFEMILANK